jgi:hypothetical protein
MSWYAWPPHFDNGRCAWNDRARAHARFDNVFCGSKLMAASRIVHLEFHEQVVLQRNRSLSTALAAQNFDFQYVRVAIKGS